MLFFGVVVTVIYRCICGSRSHVVKYYVYNLRYGVGMHICIYYATYCILRGLLRIYSKFRVTNSVDGRYQ